MSDVQQPVVDKPVTEDAPAAQTTESTAPAASESAPTEAAATETKPETAATEAPTTETSTSEAPKIEDDKAKVEAEPVTHGALGYKGSGWLKFKFSKNYFWFGDEAITPQHMDKFLRGEKSESAYPTTAWASHTGKGLLLFAKHSDQMKTPDGAINLADITDVTKEGSRDFSFKYHDHKNTFQASNEKERDGWLAAIEKTSEEAKASKEGILNSDKYKETIGNLNKPATLATGAAAAVTGKKSTDATNAEDTNERRKDSSEADDAKKKSKSRSVSRGNKRGGLFGTLIGKKEERDEQKELKKEEKAEEKAEKKAEKEEKKEEKKVEKEEEKEEKEESKDAKEGEAVAAGTGAGAVAAAVDGAASDDKKTTEATPEKNTTATNKSGKRSSIFGSFFEKVRSPVSEKKESDVGPVPPPKDDAPPVLPATDSVETAPPAPPKDKPEEATVAGAATGAATEEAKNEKTTTPGKEKENFFKRFLSDSKIKTQKPEAVKDEAKEGAENAAATEEATNADAATDKPTDTGTTETPAKPVTEPLTTADATGPVEKKDEATTPNQAKRTSIFGTLKGKVKDTTKSTDKSDAEKSEGEEKKSTTNKLGGIFRNPSKAIKSSTPSSAPAKKDDVAGTKSSNDKADTTVPAATTEPAAASEPVASNANTESNAIGDVVPEAVSVGQEQGAPAVQATA